jgi:hypothetical protein
MQEIVPGFLYSYPYVSSENYNSITASDAITLIVDLRKSPNLWYEEKFPPNCVLTLELPGEGDVYLDTRRSSPKDKHKTVKELCKRIVTEMRKGTVVYMITKDVNKNIIVALCKHWYEGFSAQTDPLKTIRGMTTPEKEQITKVLEFARKFDNCPYIEAESKPKKIKV